MTPGCTCLGNHQCAFTVWAPEKEQLRLHLTAPLDRIIPMVKDGSGYFIAVVDEVPPGSRYFLQPEGEGDLPDPASAHQPDGVHGASAVVDHAAYDWEDATWRGIPFGELILYELHVGTFTPEGTFEAIIPRLPALAELGVNALELMPVAQFPGDRNWGYDGAYLYAVQHSYGGPEGLKKLVDACHRQGIAVFLDVVYNHLGPEGNYLERFGPYYTDQYSTPWGKALNFDGDWSDGVREFVVENMRYWFEIYHIDGLRLDAIHAMFDSGAVSLWELAQHQIGELRQRLGRPLYLIAESDLNSPRVVKSTETGGYGFDAQWLDDFHHALYVVLHRKGRERYADFGRMEQLAKAYTDGFVHSGEYVRFRNRRHGASSAGVPGDRFVVFNQNHDQVGNRVRGERLCMLVNEPRKLMAAAGVLLAPYIPMLFMGEEYADGHPFFYFVSHSDPELIRAVREGRKKEFEKYRWDAEPPDPQSEETFQASKLHWEDRMTGEHARLLAWHTALIRLRQSHPVLRNFNKNDIRAQALGQDGLVISRQEAGGFKQVLCLFNFSEQALPYRMPHVQGGWYKVIDSGDPRWQPGMSDALLPDMLHAGREITLGPLSVVMFEQR